jgi:hypothetical protein
MYFQEYLTQKKNIEVFDRNIKAPHFFYSRMKIGNALIFDPILG